jgi:hypothetical protein
MYRLIITILFFLSFSNRLASQEMAIVDTVIEAGIIACIQKDIAKDSAIDPSIKFKRSGLLIRFNLSNILEGVLNRNYISGFKFSNTQLVKEHRDLINHIHDSLITEQRQLNKTCQPGGIQKVEKYDDNIAVVFLSLKCGNLVYAEVVSSKSILNTGDRIEIFGSVLCYLFFIQGGKVDHYFAGSVDYN